MTDIAGSPQVQAMITPQTLLPQQPVTTMAGHLNSAAQNTNQRSAGIPIQPQVSTLVGSPLGAGFSLETPPAHLMGSFPGSLPTDFSQKMTKKK